MLPLPAVYADSNSHKLYAYAYAAKSNYSLTPSSLTFTAYTPKAEMIYNQGLQNLVSSTCNRCHPWTYKDIYYGSLMSPLPSQGGSPTNNLLYKKMMGHTRGTYCKSPNDFPCSDIQSWWTAEFSK